MFGECWEFFQQFHLLRLLSPCILQILFKKFFFLTSTQWMHWTYFFIILWTINCNLHYDFAIWNKKNQHSMYWKCSLFFCRTIVYCYVGCVLGILCTLNILLNDDHCTNVCAVRTLSVLKQVKFLLWNEKWWFRKCRRLKMSMGLNVKNISTRIKRDSCIYICFTS